MTKEIIIDGVNVAECGFYHPEIDNYCHIALAFSDDYVDNDHTYLECKQNPNCYFKQLQRLKEKNTELLNIANNGGALLIAEKDKTNNYKQALEEIKEIVKPIKDNTCFGMNCGAVDWILNEINEVLNDRD